jgi:ribosomal protein S18 acetylase RimI-like enzyme
MRWATTEDRDAHAELLGTDPSPPLADRLSEDHRCYLALEGGRALHATWCSTTATWTEELQTYLAPPPGDAYIYESFTRADARGRGIYPMVLRSIAALLHLEGTRRLWVGVEETNLASVHAIRKGGFEDAFAISFDKSSAGVDYEVEKELDPLESLHIPRNGHDITR